MLPKSYQNYLKSQLDIRAYLLLEILINLLSSIKTLNLEKLATALPLPIFFESRRRKIQRFLKLPQLNLETIWIPLVKMWLESNFQPGHMYYLAIDRTNWGRINLLFVSVIWQKRAIPVYVMQLDKLGSSNFDEQTQIMTQVLPLFEKYQICLLGDREFCAVGLADWLRGQGIYFSLRLKESVTFEQADLLWQQLSQVGLQPGMSLFIHGVKVTQNRGFAPFNIAAKWSKYIKGKRPKEGWFILTSFGALHLAISAYEKRFGIEEMFRDFKSGGYNLEQTQLSGQRLLSGIILISLAYLSATIYGQTIKRQGLQKYVGRINEPGRRVRRHSSFYLGFHATDWLDVSEICQQLALSLMKMTPNKRRSYQRGKRAEMLMVARL